MYAYRAYDRRRAEEHCPDGRSGGTFNILYYMCSCVRMRAHVYSRTFIYSIIVITIRYVSIVRRSRARRRSSTLSDGHIDEATAAASTRRLADPPEATLPPFDRGPVTPTFPAPV